MSGLGISVSRSVKLMALALVLVAFTGCKGKKPWTGMYTPGDTVDNVGYKPEQPKLANMTFNHKLHAGDKQIPCQYCHSAARRSISAGIPPMNTCMGCHKIVVPERDPIKFLAAKYEKNEAIEWTKVHDLPDYVRFTHKRHVLSGVACETCHGDVKTMDTAEQVAPLQMSWCIDCHVQKGAPTSCNTCHY